MVDEAQLSAWEQQVRRLAETLRRQLGSTLCGLMQAPDIVALMLDSNGRVSVDWTDQGMKPVCAMAAAVPL